MASPAAPFIPSTIRAGSTGEAVRKWQELLTGAGYSVAMTGTFDQATVDATKSWQGSKGLTVDGIVGPASWAKMGFVQAANDPHAAFGRQTLKNVWREITGEDPSLAELQIAGAQAHLESNYGRASYRNLVTGETSGVINNWGAVQAGPPPCDPALSFEASDTGAQGAYTYCYKKYATPEEGAKHLVKHMTVLRPTSWAHMKAGDIDAWAQQMWAGRLPSGALNKDPVTGTLGYFEQAPSSRAHGIETRIAAIANTLGEPVAAKRGGPMPDRIATVDEEIPTVTKGGGLVALLALGYLGFRMLRGRKAA